MSIERKTHSWVTAVSTSAALAVALTAIPAIVATSGAAQAAHKGQAVKGGAGKRQGQGGGSVGGGGSRGGSIEDQIFNRSSGRRVIIILDDTDEGDDGPPAWAKGNRELNPHSGGGGKPGGAGTRKGDYYGDLWVILRDENGEPILDANGHVQPILSDGRVVQLTADGELPAEYDELVQEIEFGRLSVSRAPDKVTDHALEEALAKLTSATSVTIDSAGRLVADGVTIDSPLENLALYTYFMATGAAPTWLPSGFSPASLLGAAADKSGEVSIDVLVYLNTILGVNAVDVGSGAIDYYDFSSYEYDRQTAYGDLEVTYLKQDGDTWKLVTEPVMDAVFGGENWVDPTSGGADDFTQSADDARAVIEFLHDVPVPAAD